MNELSDVVPVASYRRPSLRIRETLLSPHCLLHETHGGTKVLRRGSTLELSHGPRDASLSEEMEALPLTTFL